jgi:hypothetical protein
MPSTRDRQPGEAEARDELARMPYEPLLPIEKKLIAWSLPSSQASR